MSRSTTAEDADGSTLCLPPARGAGRPLAGLYSFGSFWHIGTMYGTRYNHVMPPNTWSGGRSEYRQRRCPHRVEPPPGIVNALLVDGSVKAVKGPVNRSVWRSLGTRAGAEVVSSVGLLIAERMDKMREEMRRRTGTLDLAVPLIRQTRDEG